MIHTAYQPHLRLRFISSSTKNIRTRRKEETSNSRNSLNLWISTFQELSLTLSHVLNLSFISGLASSTQWSNQTTMILHLLEVNRTYHFFNFCNNLTFFYIDIASYFKSFFIQIASLLLQLWFLVARTS